MTASPQSHSDYTFADYLAVERESEIKHEFDAGEILAMTGGTARHSALASTPRCAISHAAMTVLPKAVVADSTPFSCASIASAAILIAGEQCFLADPSSWLIVTAHAKIAIIRAAR